MFSIYSKFHNLEKEKQERIINAALKEFTQNSYQKASTNEIIKEAGISKGSLFNYFKSKKDLYLFLFDYVIKVINEIFSEVDYNETDFFERIRQIGLVKFKIYKKYPYAFDFLKITAQEKSAEVRTEIDVFTQELISSGLERCYQNIDFSKFRQELDIKKVTDIINWTMLGFAEEQRDKVASFQDVSTDVFGVVFGEWEEYSEILKRSFYKKEYINDD
ncbi:MAG TPA: TetR/AcrR family transcriptional regulator [Halanaerobiales bacterium]|nr:TetR/AcrR family transcriptional regulator [Halanaerobiales bacterium]